jgi:hypothetical protein
MQSVIEFSRAFGLGAASAATLWLWRGGAAEWSRRFPLLRQFMKLLLWPVAGVTTLGGLWVMDLASDPKLFLLGVLAGVVAPRVTQFCVACAGSALKDRSRGATPGTVPSEVRHSRAPKKYAYPLPGSAVYEDGHDGRPSQVRIGQEQPARHKPAPMMAPAASAPAVHTAAVPLAQATSPNRAPTVRGRRDTLTKVLVTRATPLPKKPT